MAVTLSEAVGAICVCHFIRSCRGYMGMSLCQKLSGYTGLSLCQKMPGLYVHVILSAAVWLYESVTLSEDAGAICVCHSIRSCLAI